MHHPDFSFWERLESHIKRLDSLGIQCDLILFHPYDRWGFAKLPMDDAITYLDYATRRLSAFPNLWWSLANEYDIMEYERTDWEKFAAFVSENDPYKHLLSNHQMVRPWDWSEAHTTHICSQTRDLDFISALIKRFGKPMMVDECCYEGNIKEDWGNISGFELVNRFWKVVCQGGYCTHGETFLSADEVLWWAKGGVLKGESPKRILFLREILEELPGPLTFSGRDVTEEEVAEQQAAGTLPDFMRRFTPKEALAVVNYGRELAGRFEEKTYLKYYARTCPAVGKLQLPEDKTYRVEVLDVWEMTRKTICESASGETEIKLPGKEGIAVLATETAAP